jgi:hypothetical protein
MIFIWNVKTFGVFEKTEKLGAYFFGWKDRDSGRVKLNDQASLEGYGLYMRRWICNCMTVAKIVMAVYIL